MTHPSREEVLSIFQPLSERGRAGAFFHHVADDVDWLLMGHSPMSGQYTSKSEFMAATLQVLGDKVLTEPLTMRVVNVVVGNDSPEAAVEMEAIDARCKNGESKIIHHSSDRRTLTEESVQPLTNRTRHQVRYDLLLGGEI